MMSDVLARRSGALAALVGLSLLGGCVDVPHPFRHDGSGAQPPTARLAVPVSTASGTDEAGAQAWQHAMVEAMLSVNEVCSGEMFNVLSLVGPLSVSTTAVALAGMGLIIAAGVFLALRPVRTPSTPAA